MIICGAGVTELCEESELRSLTALIPEPTRGTPGAITSYKPVVKKVIGGRTIIIWATST